MSSIQTLDAKNTWNFHFEKYMRDLDSKKPVIWMGDMNVAPTALGMHLYRGVFARFTVTLDLSNPKQNWNKTPGYTESETVAFKNILHSKSPQANKFVDVWRKLHPDVQHYSYFGYRSNCRAKGIGWRLDMCMSPKQLSYSSWFDAGLPSTVVLSERLVERVKMCEIRSDIYGASDHCPVVMEIEGRL
jgi:AP endonuclease-1